MAQKEEKQTELPKPGVPRLVVVAPPGAGAPVLPAAPQQVQPQQQQQGQQPQQQQSIGHNSGQSVLGSHGKTQQNNQNNGTNSGANSFGQN